MAKPLTVGVVGCGYWGPNLIRNFRQLPGCRLKMVCDVNPDRLAHMQRLYPELQVTQNYEDLVHDPELDAIAIATPVRFHHRMARASLATGKHTFIEKPMAASVAECEELIQLAEDRGLTLMVGHTFLFSPAVRKIKEIISRGDIGPLHYIAARRLNLGLFQKDINVTWDLAPHDLSIILYIMESLPRVVSCWGNAHITPGIEDVTSLHLTFDHNRIAMVHSSWLDPKKVREMTFVGTRRMIVYDDVALHEKIKIYDARVEVPPHYDTFAEFQYSYHYGDMYVPYVKQEEPLKLECQHFLDCIRTGQKPLTSGREGLEVVRILELASQSLRKGGVPVEVNGHGAPPPLFESPQPLAATAAAS
ncbi:Gfo/Idh/MocA family oxidoreductase [Limisphaera ngatamarikiensis]|uniref:Gfo/Idh/MocA family oxidoreductase n=1 Tax=Limisphaera ngatamarikiensis TaxID=1324935 RepID=A0A6M1RV69_9BACT|nr:Gfo/Idh/MocA family oxidoreductase [Limisphaera ngatamarikiensis]NGO39264.1 Gfo/Idh/MocA family oxidoreductase [Limisphaera ngatamarikiensis]